MKRSEVYFLASSMFLAPRISPWVGVTIGIIYAVIFVVYGIIEEKEGHRGS